MKIIIDMKLHNWNEIINTNRSNRFMASSQKKKEMKDISYFLINVPKIKKYPIKLICNWHIKNVISDLDNKSIKSVLDAMQVKGILENDNCKYIQKIEYNYIKDKKDYLELEVVELE